MPVTLLKMPILDAPADVLPQRVYLRERWLSGDWQLVDWLHCTRVVWSAQPAMPHAELRYDYGRGLRPDFAQFDHVDRLADRFRWYVRIEIDMPWMLASEEGSGDPFDAVPTPAIVSWYGVLHVEADARSGIYYQPPIEIPHAPDTPASWRPRGAQMFYCYGLEHLLERQPVTTSVWNDGGTEKTVDRGLTFNDDGQPNRAAAKSNAGFEQSYAFSRHDQDHWSTRDAVEYLLAKQGPRDEDGNLQLPLEISSGDAGVLPDERAIIPDADRPVLPTEGQHVRGLLNRLLPRQRLLSWYLQPDPADETVIKLRPVSLTSVAVGEIPASQRLVKILADTPDDCVDVLKESTELAVDQVLIRGARRTSTASYATRDNSLQSRWTDAQEIKYEAGASGAGDYPAAAKRDDRRRRDADARARPEVEQVYSLLGPPDTWDGLVGDGLGGAKQPASAADDDPTAVYPNVFRELFFLPRLALRDGFDYSTDVETPQKLSSGPHEFMPPQTFFLLPDYQADRWARGDKIGRAAQSPLVRGAAGANRHFSVRVRVPQRSLAIYLQVDGAEQHAIAAGDFVGLPHDKEQGEVSFREMIATLTSQDSRWCEGRWPDTVTGPLDALQRRVIYAGDGFRQDYVAAQTVVAVNEYGELLRVPAAGFARDDSGVLTAAAEIAFACYGRTRRALEFQCRPVADLKIGQIVQAIGDATLAGGLIERTVDTAITQIDLVWPVEHSTDAEGELQPPIPRMTVGTDFAQLDALQFIDPAVALVRVANL